MNIIRNSILTLVCLMLITVCIAGCASKSSNQKSLPAALEKQAYSKALMLGEMPEVSFPVELCLVNVSNKSLAEAGISGLSDDNRASVSIPKLLWCLQDPNNAAVVDYGHLVCLNNETCRSKIINTEYIKRTSMQVSDGNKTSASYYPYDNKSEIEVTPLVDMNGITCLKLRYIYDGSVDCITFEASDREAPPQRIQYNVDSKFTITLGQPSIIAGHQDGDSTFFLIIQIGASGEHDDQEPTPSTSAPYVEQSDISKQIDQI